MPVKQEPAGQFAEARRKVEAAQAEATSFAIRDYVARVRAAVAAFEQDGNEDTFLTTMQRHHERVAREIGSVSPPRG